MKALNPEHPMSQHAQENATKFIALMIWKMRAHLKNLEVRLEVSDMEDFTRAFAGQRPVVASIGEKSAIILRLLDESGGELMLKSPEASLDHPAVKEMELMLHARRHAPNIAKDLGAVIARMELAAARREDINLIYAAIGALKALSDDGLLGEKNATG